MSEVKLLIDRRSANGTRILTLLHPAGQATLVKHMLVVTAQLRHYAVRSVLRKADGALFINRPLTQLQSTVLNL